MTSPHLCFPRATQVRALERQKGGCGSCGTRITEIGETGKWLHKYGERAEGHHVIPHKKGGGITAENCVVLCRSCHYNAHQAGKWADISIYRDLWKLPMPQKVAKVAAEYPNYKGRRVKKK